jgi:putative hydrolase of the HAD superfamily
LYHARPAGLGHAENRENLLTITTIIFDLDDTLQAQEGVEDDIILELAQQLGQQRHIPPQKFLSAVQYHANRLWSEGPAFAYCNAIGISPGECLWGRFQGDQPELKTLAEWVSTYRSQVWERALARMGINDTALAQQLSEQFIARRRTRNLVYPEVPETLRKLEARYTLALLTNGAPDVQREKFDASGLAAFFKVAVVSGEEGIGKPDPRIFQLVLHRLGAKPSQAVMVGDSLYRDVQGAQSAGLKGIWLTRQDNQREEADYLNITPDAVITSLSELPALLGD